MDNESLIVKNKHPKGGDGYKVFSIRMKEKPIKELTRSLPKPDVAAVN